MDRRAFFQSGSLIETVRMLSRHRDSHSCKDSSLLVETTISKMMKGLETGQWTSRDLVQAYIDRIRRFDQSGPTLRSVLEINADALEIADRLDKERISGKRRGPLHGIPLLLKDNLDTADHMKTTAGSLALMTAPIPMTDSFVAGRLRQAGAILLGKTNLSEWANFRSDRSTSAWSGRGGLTRNPYLLDRNPSGSSSGSAVAVSANLCAAAIGTETDGSIISPSNNCGIVGIKPTVGLVSRSGIIPIAHSQDTAGPMSRNVRDAAILLTIMAGYDSNDPATLPCSKRSLPDYSKYLVPEGLKGARIGFLQNKLGKHPHVDKIMEDSMNAMREAGAVLVEIEHQSRPYEDAEMEVLLYEFRSDLNSYLGRRGGPMKDLAALIDFNEKHRTEEMPYFGQEIFLRAENKGPLSDQKYREALETCRRLSRKEGIDALMEKHRLEAIASPSGRPAPVTDLVNGNSPGISCSTPAAVAGYPHITVPAGFIFGLPVGLSFFGRPWSEAKLFQFAYAFEKSTCVRRPPQFLTELPNLIG